MPAKDLGTKHTCWKCATKYYDLKKPDPVCPKCGADPRQAPSPKALAAAEKRAAKAAAAKPVPAEVDEVPELPDEELEEEADEVEEEAEPDDE
jgi:uncharacterized protein (TIGR02300 family)